MPALREELHLPVRCETLAKILPGMSGKEGQKRPEKPVCEDSRIVCGGAVRTAPLFSLIRAPKSKFPVCFGPGYEWRRRKGSKTSVEVRSIWSGIRMAGAKIRETLRKRRKLAGRDTDVRREKEAHPS